MNGVGVEWQFPEGKHTVGIEEIYTIKNVSSVPSFRLFPNSHPIPFVIKRYTLHLKNDICHLFYVHKLFHLNFNRVL